MSTAILPEVWVTQAINNRVGSAAGQRQADEEIVDRFLRVVHIVELVWGCEPKQHTDEHEEITNDVHHADQKQHCRHLGQLVDAGASEPTRVVSLLAVSHGARPVASQRRPSRVR